MSAQKNGILILILLLLVAAVLCQSTAELYNLEGTKAFQLRQLEAAENHFRAATQLDALKEVYWYNLGVVQLVQKRYWFARDSLGTALLLVIQQPNNAQVHAHSVYENIALCDEKMGSYEAALNSYLLAAQSNRGCCDAGIARVSLLLSLRTARFANNVGEREQAALRSLVQPLSFSVIVPCFNCAESITRTLASVEASIAKYESMSNSLPSQHHEIIVVNDASTDDSARIISEFVNAGRPSIYQIVSVTENAGRSWARELGVRASKADVLLFCDSDDVFYESHVSECVSALEITEAEFASTTVAIHAPIHELWKREFSDILLLSKCVRRSCHDRIGGFPSEPEFRIPGFEDIYYTTMLLNRCSDVWIPRETVEYVRREGNTLDRNIALYQTPPDTTKPLLDDSDPDWSIAQKRMRDTLGRTMR